jgi:hypothetical protein
MHESHEQRRTRTTAMNLRENQLSARSVIPVALALPINRGPVDLRVREERERQRREAEYEASFKDPSVHFFIS